MKVKFYEFETSHTIDGHIKTAALLSMCPHDLQDIAFHDLKTTDDPMIFRDIMRTYVSNRSSAPSPMDVGHVEHEHYYDYDHE